MGEEEARPVAEPGQGLAENTAGALPRTLGRAEWADKVRPPLWMLLTSDPAVHVGISPGTVGRGLAGTRPVVGTGGFSWRA